MNKVITVLFVVLLFSGYSAAADELTYSYYAQDIKNDSLGSSAETGSINDSNSVNFKISMGFKNRDRNYLKDDSPTLSLQYGIAKSSYDNKNFNAGIAQNGILSANIGYTSIARISDGSLLEYDYNYLAISNANRELFASRDAASEEFKSRLWRMGIVSSDGYGWAFNDKIFLMLYHSRGINWTSLDIRHSAGDSASIQAIKTFGKQIRYGKQFSGGAKLFVASSIALNVEYEKSMIYPRHLFWKEMLSNIIEGSAQGLATMFVNKVKKESPIFVPIVHFALKNAISYGFYELYKSKMNWPTKTVAPFMNESFKVGVEFLF